MCYEDTASSYICSCTKFSLCKFQTGCITELHGNCLFHRISIVRFLNMEADIEKGTSNGIPKKEENEVSPFRKALPQILASSAKNLILLDLGMTVAFPTLVIPALLNSTDHLSFDISQASWFGSIAFICQPVGSIISGTVLEPLGRKNSMLLVNVPHLLGWYLFYWPISVSSLFVAAILMGLGVGFMEAPVLTYVGEISEPRLRGILTSYSSIFISIGLIIELLLGTLYGWRTTAFISSFVPIITIIAISQIPETPMWLLSRGRVKEAEKSLCWLRGWVPASYVQKELNELIRYSNASKLVLKEKKSKVQKNSQSSKSREQSAYSNPVSMEDETPLDVNSATEIKSAESPIVVKCSNEMITQEKKVLEPTQISEVMNLTQIERKATLKEMVCDMVRPQMLKPLSLVIAFFIFNNGTGLPAMRPYYVKIFEELRFPVNPHWATVIISCFGFLGVIVCTSFVSCVGKRWLTLASLSGCAICMLGLTIWTLLNENTGETMQCWTPFILFIVLIFSFSFGIAPIPWMIISEVFPLRGRGFASGLAAAVSYIMGFISSKTFFDLKSCLGLSGVFSFYGSITILGIVYVYFKLPETEGKTLEDIENSYKSKKSKNFTSS